MLLQSLKVCHIYSGIHLEAVDSPCTAMKIGAIVKAKFKGKLHPTKVVELWVRVPTITLVYILFKRNVVLVYL